MVKRLCVLWISLAAFAAVAETQRPKRRSSVPLLVDAPPAPRARPAPHSSQIRRAPATVARPAPPPLGKPSPASRVPLRVPRARSAPGFRSENVMRSPFDPVSVVEAWIGPGLAFYNGHYNQLFGGNGVGMAMNIGLVRQWSATVPVYVGADLSLNLWDFTLPGSQQRQNVVGIQALPTAYYKFENVIGGISPYLGLSVGPHIHIGQSSASLPTSRGSETTLYFQALVRPGVTVEITKDFGFNLEPKFGVLRTEFIFLPQLTANLSL